MSQVFCEWMRSVKIQGKDPSIYSGFVQWEMEEFGVRKAQRYPLAMLPQHSFQTETQLPATMANLEAFRDEHT